MVVTDVSGRDCPETSVTTILRCVTSAEERVLHSKSVQMTSLQYVPSEADMPGLCQDLGDVFHRSDNSVRVHAVYSSYGMSSTLIITVQTYIVLIIVIIYCNWDVTRWQWLFYVYTKHEIGYYQI